MDAFVEDQTFETIDFKAKPPAKGHYDHCTFLHCDLSSVNLSEIIFVDCVFTGCNLSMAAVSATVFRDVRFGECKMLGMRFDQASMFGLACGFGGCILDHSSFYAMKMKKTNFSRCQLRQVDFTGCDLSQAVFDGCDLADAVFERTVLEKADLRGAFNYSIDPAGNRVKKARFSLEGVRGLLGKYDILIE
ncbi:MAG TPA: pentapeptide repeat-containing protein [Puia sp.]|uniref:pentapeptide repeat-containing protein n=1 Tax=Puia sp. TaxID=2045100 RepID=UPI002CB66353|nr:pentapeptide repeat-containing protein [Puia sp.]HVU94020.1 pentapeptide repeat-containing protein [Puia sp.]